MAPSSIVGTALMTFYGGLTAWGLYGLYFGLFCVSIHVLCFRPNHKKRNWFLIGASIAIYVFTTIDILLLSNSLLVGFFDTSTALVRDQHFAGGGSWTYAFQDAVRLSNMLLADAVLLYRVWAVWNRRWQMIAFNVLLWLATLATSIRVVQLEGYVVASPAHAATLYELNNWSIACQALTFAQNVISTALIVLRLWALDRRAAALKPGSLLPVVRIVVESGAMYTALLLANISVSSALNWAVLVVTQLISPIIGITFSLIIVRVALGLAWEGGSPTDPDATESHRVDVTFDRDGRDDASALEDGDRARRMESGGEKQGLRPPSVIGGPRTP